MVQILRLQPPIISRETMTILNFNRTQKTLLVMCLALAFAHMTSPTTSAQIVPDSIFQEWKPNTPGGVACVLHHGNVVYEKSGGLADVKKGIPNSADFKYDLASNAKQFTAMCIALLEELGKMSGEDPLRKYYPNLKIKDDVRI